MPDRGVSPSVKVKRVLFDFTFADQITAMEARQQVQTLCETALQPVIEQVFSGVPPEYMFVLDQLTVDLGYLQPGDLSVSRLPQIINEQLSRQVSRLEPVAHLDDRPAPSPVDELVYFLKWGMKPWNALYQNQAELEVAIQTLAPFEQDILEDRLAPLLQDHRIRTRLVYQFSPRFLFWLVNWRQPARSTEIWQAAQSAWPDASPSVFAQLVLAVVARLQNEEVPMPKLAAWLQQARGSGEFPGATTQDSKLETIIGSMVSLEGLLQPHSPIDAHHRELDWEGALFVEGGGVVLLHPFLERFFRRCSLLDNLGTFSSPQSQATAVHLLHYLVTSQEQPAEEHTVLYKLLCGQPFETPLEREVVLSVEQHQEAEKLLQAAIDHWQKLGNTTPDGLRQGFLQRSGRLAADTLGWRLLVEQRSIDVLLEFLPWPLSLIRFPWLTDPIWVDWA